MFYETHILKLEPIVEGKAWSSPLGRQHEATLIFSRSRNRSGVLLGLSPVPFLFFSRSRNTSGGTPPAFSCSLFLFSLGTPQVVWCHQHSWLSLHGSSPWLNFSGNLLTDISRDPNSVKLTIKLIIKASFCYLWTICMPLSEKKLFIFINVWQKFYIYSRYMFFIR